MSLKHTEIEIIANGYGKYGNGKLVAVDVDGQKEYFIYFPKYNAVMSEYLNSQKSFKSLYLCSDKINNLFTSI